MLTRLCQHRHSHPPLKIENGFALLLCLLFLTVLTLQGLSASSETIVQDRLATNLHESESARQSAMAAQAWAESWLMQLDGMVPGICAQTCIGLKIHAPGSLPPHPETEKLSWWLDQGHIAGIDPLTGDRIDTISVGSIDPPVWIIEAVHETAAMNNGDTPAQTWYRILARGSGSGRTSTGVSVVESILARSWVATGRADEPGSGQTPACPNTEPATRCGRQAWRELR